MKPNYLFLTAFVCLAVALALLDRSFLKQNDGFCLRTILGQMPSEPNPLLPEALRKTLDQPFYYFAKGHQSYVFASADGEHVLKCYRFPSQLRLFSWLNHPISHFFSHKREEIRAYNEQKLKLSFSSYKLALEQLQEETGTEWIHLKPTNTIQQQIHLIDRSGNHYHVPIDALSLVLQKRFVMIFDALKTMHAHNDQEQMRKLIGSLFTTIADLWNRKIIDKDPVLANNYGWDGNRVVYIDIGRFAPREETIDHFTLPSYIQQITPILVDWLQQNEPQLLEYYNELLKKMN